MVRVVRRFDNEVLHQQTLELSAPADEFDPAYAQLAELPDTDNFTRIELVPLTPGVKFWAFLTMTNNTTQEITLVTPQ